MDMNLLSGSIGMPSYHFFKQHGAVSTQTLAASALKQSNEERNDRHLEARARARSALPNEERAETARCNGMLHACANWMALKTGKMRIITYGEGSWVSLPLSLSHARSRTRARSLATTQLHQKP
jgi:hypothetical protein